MVTTTPITYSDTLLNRLHTLCERFHDPDYSMLLPHRRRAYRAAIDLENSRLVTIIKDETTWAIQLAD